MPPSNPSSDRGATLLRFGVFEVDLAAGELRKNGARIRLQEQPFQVLAALLQHSGQVVTRDDLRASIWPADTFVDFDHSLNTAVNKIREALGDSAASPQYVETLAKRGYRFIAPVEVQSVPSGNAVPAASAQQTQREPPPQSEAAPDSARGLLTQPEETPRAPHVVVRSLLLLLQVMYLCFYVVSLKRLKNVEHVVSGAVSSYFWVVVLVIVTAAVGIPIRLYLVSGLAFNPPGLRRNFLKLFPAIFLLDLIWALAPFLLIGEIGFGLALASTAALLYSPFAQRSLILMGTAPQ